MKNNTKNKKEVYMTRDDRKDYQCCNSRHEEWLENDKVPAVCQKSVNAYDKNLAKVKKIYDNVEWTEIFDISLSLTKWLLPRLKKLKERWEDWVELEKDKKQKEIYERLIEMIELSEYIIEQKWDDEFEYPDNPNIDSSNGLPKDYFIPTGDLDEEGEPLFSFNEKYKPTPEQDEYYKKIRKIESQKLDRWLEIINKDLWKWWS